MQRRAFIRNTALAGAGLLIAPKGLFGADAPSNKLNLALLGVGGRGAAHFDSIGIHNVVALCDVRESAMAPGAKRFPQAKTYIDWRKLLDDHKQLGLDAVVCCTADHHHALIANWCINRDLHCYMEKPLAITVEEARVVRANWLAKRHKLATQVGMQRHALSNFNRVREKLLDGVIGELKSASAWGSRKLPRAGYWPAAGNPPADFHWDLWLGPAPDHPYSPEYFSYTGTARGNCTLWNMFWDFGVGQVGDMGSHTMDLLWNGVDAKLPTSAEAKGEKFNPAVTPVECEMRFEHPANNWRGPISIAWYQGGAMPKSPRNFIDLEKIDHGVMFKGTQGFLIASFENHIVLPYGKEADLTYYKPRPKEKLLPPVGHFQEQWLAACKNPSLKTACDYEYSADMIEQMLLGLVAYRVGKKLNYDGAAGKVTNCPEANALLRRSYRAGWPLNG